MLDKVKKLDIYNTMSDDYPKNRETEEGQNVTLPFWCDHLSLKILTAKTATKEEIRKTQMRENESMH